MDDRQKTTPDFANPLPQRYLTDTPGVGGTLKARPEDFIVEEIPVYEPQGSGDHLYLRVQKTNVSHGELMSVIRRRFDVGDTDVGYAGMKDKHAITQQTVSVYLPHEFPERTHIDLGHERVQLMWAERHKNRIKRGHLRGNRFVIRIRDVEPLHAVRAKAVLDVLERTGVPAYFGSQRFGYRHNNHRLGSLLLAGRWDDVAAEMLGATGSAFPEHQRERREQFDAGDYAAAAEAWSTADRAELIAARAFARGQNATQAVRRVGKTTLSFWTSSFASSLFNRLTDARIEHGTIDALVDGDIAWKHDSRATFPIGAELAASGELEPRLERLEISPTGALWGRRGDVAGGAPGDHERALFDAAGIDSERYLTSRYAPIGQRRPFRTPLINPQLEGGFDEHGPFIRVTFELNRGMYATVALREIMKADESPAW